MYLELILGLNIGVELVKALLNQSKQSRQSKTKQTSELNKPPWVSCLKTSEYACYFGK